MQTTEAIERCAPWTRAQGVDPIGSAGAYDAVLLVESPQPWPSDVREVPALSRAATRDPRTRVLAVVPRAEDDTGLVRVVHWRRVSSTRFEGTDHRVERGAVADLLDRLVDDPQASLPSALGASPPEVLVCAHGKRDACCGRWGTLLNVEIAARWDGVRTWRCSHTGGHRFAPTGITFPDGRAWAFLDVEALDAIVGRTRPPETLREHYRGTLALDPWGQAVERELLCRLGWEWLDHEVTGARTELAPDGRSARVRLDWTGPAAAGSAHADVVVNRDVPVLVCGEPPEEAKKTSPELAVASLRIS